MKVFLFITALICCLSLNAQPVLDRDNIPFPGNVYYFNTGISPGITPPAVGEDTVWDYSSIAIQPTFASSGYMVPFALKEQHWSFDPVEISEDFFSTTDTNLLYEISDDTFRLAYKFTYYCGYGGSSWEGYFGLKLTLLPIPFKYGDSFSDIFELTDWRERSEASASAYGTLILPDTIYDPVIMVYRFQQHYCYEGYGGPGPYVTIDNKIYQFFTENSNVPVFSITFYKYEYIDHNDYTWWYDTTLLVFDHTELLPVLMKCPADTVTFLTIDTCCSYIELQPPLVSHAPELITLWNDYTGTSSASTYYPAGTTKVTWYAQAGTDTASCSMRVFVLTNGINETFGNNTICSISPNPAKETVHFNIKIVEPQVITLKIFDSYGRKLYTVIDDWMAAGDHRVDFDTEQLASGLYFYQITSEHNHEQARSKLVVLR